MQILLKKESLALPTFNLAYKFGTDNPTILASYGLMLLRQNEANKALKCFERGYKHSKHYMTTKTLMSNIAICHWKSGDLDKAIESYMAIIKRFGTDDQIFLSKPDYSEEAIEQFRSDNSILYPQDYNTIGYLYILKEEYDKATFFTKAALVDKEDYASAYDNLGQIAYSIGDMVEAKIQYKKKPLNSIPYYRTASLALHRFMKKKMT